MSSRRDLGINDGCAIGCLSSLHCAIFRRCFRGAGLKDSKMGLMPEPKRVKRATLSLPVAWTRLWLACLLSTGNFEVIVAINAAGFV